MASVELEIVRSGSSEFVVQALPDGSTAIFEVATKNVYSLNPSAAAAWEACASVTTLSRLAAEMSRRLNRPVTEDLAHEAVSELVAVGLVSATPADRLGTSRRAMLKQVAGVALPVVLVLTGAQQRAHAQSNGSNPVTPTTPGPGTTSPGTTSPGLPTTTREPLDFDIFKSYGPPSDLTIRLPLPGAVFEVKNAQGTVVGTMTTNTDGFATIELPPGTYTFTETFAPSPPGPFQPLPVLTVTLTDDDQGRDLHNLLVNPL